MSSKKVMMMSWKGLARPKSAPMVIKAAAAAKSEPTMLEARRGEGGREGKERGRERGEGEREGESG